MLHTFSVLWVVFSTDFAHSELYLEPMHSGNLGKHTSPLSCALSPVTPFRGWNKKVFKAPVWILFHHPEQQFVQLKSDSAHGKQ